jgi:hypothetical protein
MYLLNRNADQHVATATQTHLEVHSHVAKGLGAQGAGVVVPCVLPKAMRVHEMPARQLLQVNDTAIILVMCAEGSEAETICNV